MGGGGGNQQSAQVNRINEQQAGNYGQFSSGLSQAEKNSNAVFDAAFGGYNSLLNNLRGSGGGGGGGGASARIRGGGGGGGFKIGNALAGIAGPDNPWAGELGTDIRTRGNSILPSFYGQIQSEQDRLQNIQGGYNPGYTAQMSKLANDMAHAGQQNVLETNIGLGERSAQAAEAQRQWEIQKSKAGAAAALANQRLKMQQQAMMRSASGAAAQSQSQNYAMQLAALGALSNLRTDVPGGQGQYIQGLMGNTQLGYGGAQMGQNQGWGTKEKVGMGASVAVPIAVALI